MCLATRAELMTVLRVSLKDNLVFFPPSESPKMYFLTVARRHPSRTELTECESPKESPWNLQAPADTSPDAIENSAIGTFLQESGRSQGHAGGHLKT